ncbi:hypothetical protein D6817_04470 [Candidatus Pacearchaeota archaeon]|nr:MAG: hypothetical protein D6817_04470 [Candidatus Pacearchaeota archaeon]
MIEKRICPNCGSDDLVMAAGGVMGIFVCKRCGYRGSVFPVRQIDKQAREEKQAPLKSKPSKRRRA